MYDAACTPLEFYSKEIRESKPFLPFARKSLLTLIDIGNVNIDLTSVGDYYTS